MLYLPIQKAIKIQNMILKKYKSNSKNYLCYSFAFIYIYYGSLKPLPVETPVRTPVGLFVSQLGITDLGLTLGTIINFIGLFEILIGILFLFKKIRIVFPFFMSHMFVTLSAPFVLPYAIFKAPFIHIFNTQIPFVMDKFAAFAIKNVIFLNAYLYLASNELVGDKNK